MRAVGIAAFALGYAASAALAASWPEEAIERAILDLLAETGDPAFLHGGPDLTVKRGKGDRWQGKCTGIFDVVVEDANSVSRVAPCIDGTWQATVRGGGKPKRVSQITRYGAIAVRQVAVDPVHRPPRATQSLRETLAGLRAGEKILLRPEVITSGTVVIPRELGGTPSRPTVLDGGHAVIFTGSAGIEVRAGHVVLTGFRFEHTRGTALSVTAPGAMLMDSTFIGCGDPLRPQSQCIIATGNARGLRIEGNSFVGSNAMTIKVRSSDEVSAPQPAAVLIRYNLFADIHKHSSNGQEPIQIAGPGGGEGKIVLGTRVEHNIFLRANGDAEAISFKTPGNMARWNVFYHSDSAPNFRGAPDNAVTGNLLYRTRPLRIAGKRNRISGNVIACPTQSVAVVLTLGSPGYRAAEDSVVSGNIILARDGLKYAAQEPPGEPARRNAITDNLFMTWQPGYAHAPAMQTEEVALGNRFKSNKNFTCANH